MMASERTIKPLEVKAATELAEFYGVPQTLVNMFFVDFGGAAYPKEPFLVYLGNRKGYQRIDVTKPALDKDGEWGCEARIYPKVDLEVLREINKLPDELKAKVWAYMTEPTKEWGHASTKNVHMSTMHAWLPEIAIKRAVCRALRIFSGYGGTSYEELPEAPMSSTELREGKDYHVVQDAPKEEEAPGTAELKTFGPPKAFPAQVKLIIQLLGKSPANALTVTTFCGECGVKNPDQLTSEQAKKLIDSLQKEVRA